MIRYLVLVGTGVAGDHLQSLLLGSLLISTAVVFLVLGLVAELSKIHRYLTEEQTTFERLTRKDEGLQFLAHFGSSIWKKDGTHM